MTKTGAITAGCVITSPVYIVGAAVTLVAKSGGIKTRTANAVIWPVLLLPYGIDSDHTVGGFRNKQLMQANRRLDRMLRH